jgi:hypothetical protein
MHRKLSPTMSLAAAFLRLEPSPEQIGSAAPADPLGLGDATLQLILLPQVPLVTSGLFRQTYPEISINFEQDSLKTRRHHHEDL